MRLFNTGSNTKPAVQMRDNAAWNDPSGSGENQFRGRSGDDDFSWFGSGGESGAISKYDALGKGFDSINPYIKAAKAQKEKEKRDQERWAAFEAQTKGINEGLSGADTAYKGKFDDYSGEYLGKADGLVSDYLGVIKNLKDQAGQQATDSRATYRNSILPEFKNAMGMAKTNAESAMTLQEAGDPNNPIMTQVRALYDKQGQAARKQGQQDFGTLSALGAQAAQGQFGAAGPMTSGQMGQIYGANQQQAGDAYARAQNRMYDLQQQGIDKGFDQSNQMYQFGQDAQGRYSDTIKDIQQGEANYGDLMQGFRGERAGYAGDTLGVSNALNADHLNMGMMGAGIDKGNAYAGAGRDQNLLNQQYGVQGQMDANETNRKAQGRGNEIQFLSTLASMFAGGAGQIKPRQGGAQPVGGQAGQDGYNYSNYA